MALNIDLAEARLSEGSRKGLILASEYLVGVARSRTPHEEGDLERTGRPEVHGGDHATVTFGGQGLPDYAQFQHYEEDLRHDPGRTHHYLEDPLHEEAQVLKRLIGKGVRSALD